MTEKNDEAALLILSNELSESSLLMSNTELAQAIDRAHQSAGSHSELQKLWATHLEVLLKMQSTRAAYICNSNAGIERPMVPQKGF